MAQLQRAGKSSHAVTRAVFATCVNSAQYHFITPGTSSIFKPLTVISATHVGVNMSLVLLVDMCPPFVLGLFSHLLIIARGHIVSELVPVVTRLSLSAEHLTIEIILVAKWTHLPCEKKEWGMLLKFIFVCTWLGIIRVGFLSHF
jgi:hypothetical protein